MSDGRIQVTYYAANERVKAFDSFDEVASGNSQMYHGAITTGLKNTLLLVILLRFHLVSHMLK